MTDELDVINYWKIRALEAEKKLKKEIEWNEANKATGICETCTHETLKENDRLKAENEILHTSLSNIGTWRCNKCGHYTPFGYVCFNCRHDRSIEEEDDE